MKVARQYFNLLTKLYPEVQSELNFKNDYQLVISVLLSAQCTDKKVNQVTPELFSKYPDFYSLSNAKIPDLERIIKPINYYKTKAKNLKDLGKMAVGKYKAKLPSNRQDLESLPGVGRKTANVILSEKGIEPALAVDTHVLRLANRLGLSKKKTAIGVEEDLKALYEPKDWRELHHRLIFHGRRVCNARKPNCLECILNTICPKIGLS